MDFISYVENQKEKLQSFDYPNFIWNIINNYETNTNVSATLKQEYKYHLPIDFKDFLTSCIEKLDDIQKETADLLLGEQLRIYILTLIYWCFHEEEEADILLLASEFYVRLISFKDNICFKSSIYKTSLNVIEKNIGHNILPFLKQLKVFISTQSMEPEQKQLTLDLLVDVIQNKSSSVMSSFEIETSTRADHEALLCIRAMALKEETNLGLFSICMCLLCGVRSTTNNNLTRQNLATIQTNMKNLIKDLYQSIVEGSYPALKSALVYSWTLQNFEYCEYATSIMNDMDSESYQSLIEKLRSMIISRDDTCKRNLIRLSYAILCNPSTHYASHKLDVLFQTLIRSIIINTCSSNTDVCDTAVEATSNMCSARNEKIDKNFKVVLLSELDMINKDTFFKRLKALVDIKWKNKIRNKNICIIVCYLMTHVDVSENTSICIQILKMLSEEATPYYLKPCLLTLTSVYVQMKKQEKELLASAVFDILYKMALHPASTSSEFLKHMYSSMLYPVKIDGNSYDGELFITPLISEDYNFDEFFKKCDSLALLKPEHVKKLITELNKDRSAHLKLLCSILEYITYTEFLQLTDFISENFDSLIDDVNTKYHFYALNKILSKRRGIVINNTTTFDKMYRLKVDIESCIKEQKFPSKVVGNALSLLKSLNALTNSGISEDTIEACNKSLEETFSNIHSSTVNLVPILYASEMALLMNYMPNETCRSKLDEVLKYFSSSSSKTDQQQNYEIWTFCLILQTSLAMQSKDFVESTVQYLRSGIKSKTDVVKLTSLRLLYDVSNVITRNFENLVGIMFGELTGDSTIIKKTCVGYIEKLVRDEYLRLDTSQYLRLMCLLRDHTDGMDEYIKKLLTENFIISHQSTIAKNFVPLIIHFNEYKKHPVIHIDRHVIRAVQKTNQTVINKKDMYTFLFKPLTIKSQFNVLKELCCQIFNNIIEENLRCDTGYWDIINDALLIVKISSSETHTLSEERFYSKNISIIEKNVVERNKQYSDKPKYIEFQNEIKQITQTLLKLLFFNESDHFLRNIKAPLFDAIIYWTNYLLPDIVHLVHEENSQRIKILYSKLPNFYRKEIQPPRSSRNS